MLAIRMVSSEKFKHIYSYNIATREEDEIKRILSRFQIVESSGNEERKMPPLNFLGKLNQNDDAMTQSANSQRQMKPAASKASSDELQI